jgi:hypothetical protein
MTHRTRLTIASVVSALAVPGAVFAQQTFIQKVQSGAAGAAQPAGFLGAPPLETIIGNVIGIALGFVGIILFGIMIYGGFLYMTAGGNDKQVTAARQWIVNSIIGLIIITTAYAISTFVLTSLTGATTGGGVVSGQAPPP